MPTVLYLYENLLRELEYAEMDVNFKNLRTTADGASPKAGPGSEQAFSVGALTAAGTIVAPSLVCTTGNLEARTNLLIGGGGDGQIMYSGGICFNTWTGAIYQNRLHINTATGNVLVNTMSDGDSSAKFQVAGPMKVGGNIGFFTDNSYNLGSATYRAAVIYAGTGTINTSDAREKTAVTPLATAEIEAAKALAKEIGTYKFLTAIADKGDQARYHIGMTVQRAIEIMTAHDLDPYVYGFICYDQWEDKFIDHPAIEAVVARAAQPAEYITALVEEPVIVNGEQTMMQRSKLICVKEEIQAIEAVEAKPAWREQIQTAGDRYSFRTDELLLFISRGFEARLTALEGN